MEQNEVNSENLKSLDGLSETDIKIIGDWSTICQVIQLLAYIRHAIKNKKQTEIKVNIGSNVNSDFFSFQVNNAQIRDYISKDYIEIN